MYLLQEERTYRQGLEVHQVWIPRTCWYAYFACPLNDSRAISLGTVGAIVEPENVDKWQCDLCANEEQLDSSLVRHLHTIFRLLYAQ